MEKYGIDDSLLERLQRLSNDDPNTLLQTLINQHERGIPESIDILNNIDDAFFCLRRDWTVVYLNGAAEKLLQRTHAELHNKNVWDEFPEAVNLAFYTQYQQAFETQQTVAFTAYFPPLDIWLEVRAYPTPQQLSLYFHDVSERVRREQTDQAHAERLRLVINSTPIFLFSTDQDGIFIYADGSGIEGLDLTPGELIGKSIFDVNEGRLEIIEKIRQTLNGEKIHYFPNVDDTPYEVWMLPYYNEHGQIAGITGVSLDITARKQAEAAATLSREVSELRQRNIMKTRMMRMISHEFRTPLAIIQSSVSLLLRYYNQLTEDKREKRLNSLQSQVQHMTTLLAQLEHATDLETTPLTPTLSNVRFNDAMRLIVADLAETIASDHHLRYQPGSQADNVTTDIDMVRVIINNLVENAVKFSQPGTTITLQTTYSPSSVTIYCQDEGIGVPPEDQPHIFESLYRGRNVEATSGTGLGLHTAWHFAAALGGTINIDEIETQGTRIVVRIPCQPEP